MTENKTGVRLPVSRKKQMAERQARESLAAVAQGWGAGAPQQSQAECEGVRNVTEELSESPVLVRIPEEEKPAKGETLSAAARRRIWERSRYESMRMQPDAMAFHEEALARARQQGEFEKLAKVNGLSEEEVRRVWDVHQDHHRIRVAAQAAGRTAEVPEDEDADFDELQTGEVSAREPTNEPEADVPREKVEEPRSKFTEAPDPHAISVTQPKPEPKPFPVINPSGLLLGVFRRPDAASTRRWGARSISELCPRRNVWLARATRPFGRNACGSSKIDCVARAYGRLRRGCVCSPGFLPPT